MLQIAIEFAAPNVRSENVAIAPSPARFSVRFSLCLSVCLSVCVYVCMYLRIVMRVYVHHSASVTDAPACLGSGLCPIVLTAVFQVNWVSRCLLELRMMEVVSGDNWSYRSCKAPVTSSPTNQLADNIWLLKRNSRRTFINRHFV